MKNINNIYILSIFIILFIITSCNNPQEKNNNSKATYRSSNKIAVDTFRRYYPSGTLKEIYTEKNNKPDGLHRIYSENGDIIYEVNYKNGKKHGYKFEKIEMIYYNKNKAQVIGALIKKTKYSNGNVIIKTKIDTIMY